MQHIRPCLHHSKDDSRGNSKDDASHSRTIPSYSKDDTSMGRSTSSPNRKDGRTDPNRWKCMDVQANTKDRSC
ncbi:MAG: hypothetical protein MJZ20_02550 [Bacteroidaceae bacterium]|nr:hypothetical protein [Bacteroidaceae bacterium]